MRRKLVFGVAGAASGCEDCFAEVKTIPSHHVSTDDIAGAAMINAVVRVVFFHEDR